MQLRPQPRSAAGERTVEVGAASDRARRAGSERIDDADVERIRSVRDELIGDRTGAGAVASAGVGNEKQQPRHGLSVTDTASNYRPPFGYNYAAPAAGGDKAMTQVPLGELDVQVTVEVDYAIG